MSLPSSPPESSRRRKLVDFYVAVGAVCLLLAGMAILWRTDLFVLVLAGACLWPCFLPLIAILLYRARRFLMRNPLHSAFATIAILLSFFGGLSDEEARRLIFRWNYPLYRDLATNLPQARTRDIVGFSIGVYEVEAEDGLLRIDTGAGPTLETVFFSPKPLLSPHDGWTLEPVRRDDLGFWYFAVEHVAEEG